MIGFLVCALAAASSDLRVVAASPQRMSDLSATEVSVRVWWSGQASEVQVAKGGGWQAVGEGIAPLEIARLARGTAVRIRQDGVWSEPAYVPRSIGPAQLAQLSGPSGSMLAGEVGQIARADRSTAIWASTLGGGLASVGPGGELRVMTRWDGLPDDRVLAVSTHGARVLVGTADGAALLESGEVQKTFRLPDGENHVQATLLTDEVAWVGSPHGLYTVDPMQRISSGSVYSIAERGDGGIWVGQGGVRTHPGLPGQMAEEVALSGDHIYDILNLPQGIAVASHERGVWASGPNGLAPHADYPYTEAYGLTLTGQGLWVAAGGGGLHGPEGSVYGYADGLPGRSVWSVLAGEDAESLWVGTDRGLAHFSAGVQEQPPHIDRVPMVRWPADEDVDDVLVTRRGLWLAGDRGIWTLGHPGRHAENLVVAGRSGVIALEEGGKSIWAVGERVLRMTKRGRLSTVPLRFRPTDATWAESGLWIASAQGLHRLDPETQKLDPVLALPGVSRVASEGRRVWAVADGIPVMVVGRIHRSFMNAHRVRDIAPMRGAVCLGTDSGVEHLFQDGEVTVPLGNALSGVSVPAVAHDGDGGCWYATEDGTVGRISADDSHQSMTIQTGEYGVPERIVADGDWAWVVTRKGTWRVWVPKSAQP